MSEARIPFLDLKDQHHAVREDLKAAFERTMESGWYILGNEVQQFEADFASYCQVKHCKI